MAEDRFRDFSEFAQEVDEGEKIPIRWKGHEFEVPRPSALQQLKVEKAQMVVYDLEIKRSLDPEMVLSDDEVREIRDAMAGSNYLTQMEILLGGGTDQESRKKGEEKIEEWLGWGMPIETLRGIFRYVFGLQMPDESGEAPAPNRAARRAGAKSKKGGGSGKSSRSGGSLSRTSRGSTG